MNDSSFRSCPEISTITCPGLTSTILPRKISTATVGADLDQHQVPLDEVAIREVEHLDDGDDFLELLADLVEHPAVAVDDKSHPRKLGVLGLAHREAVDIEGA